MSCDILGQYINRSFIAVSLLDKYKNLIPFLWKVSLQVVVVTNISEGLSHMNEKAMSTLYLLSIYYPKVSPGALASSCNPATWRQVLWDGLKRGRLVITSSCWSGVRTKACINMDPTGEPEGIRLTKEGRNGPGGKPSSQEFPCRSVVG